MPSIFEGVIFLANDGQLYVFDGTCMRPLGRERVSLWQRVRDWLVRFLRQEAT